MASGLKLLDGSELASLLSSIYDEDPQLRHIFDEARGHHGFDHHDEVKEREPGEDLVDSSQFLSIASSLINQANGGARLPPMLMDEALRSTQMDLSSPSDDHDVSQKKNAVVMDRPTFASKLDELLRYIIRALQENPLVVSVTDGSAIKASLEDEDDFAMLAENLFTELDIQDSGKISTNAFRTALSKMGLEMGVPDPSANTEAETMIASILKKHLSGEEEEIGQAQFAVLLQVILEDLAEALAANPITTALDLNVNNGFQLQKLLDDEELFIKVAENMFDEFDTSKDGKLDKNELKSLLAARGEEWGLPPKDSSEHMEQLYIDLFSVCDVDNSGVLDKVEFQVLLREIFDTFAAQLKSTPIFKPRSEIRYVLPTS